MLYMEFRQKMEELGNYMDHRAMGDATQQKLINHFEYLYMVQYGKGSCRSSSSCRRRSGRR